jgi:hypothetical protein
MARRLLFVLIGYCIGGHVVSMAVKDPFAALGLLLALGALSVWVVFREGRIK